ncbi:C4-dicarboxylate ABC transporter [Streptomyces pluripotens]|uniref:C4-dicarboxylate ABC transporter n=1 Tax=Streptomyces pluripotens TaxID=1355015 RepID=A0A221NV30_9ACTN|nr:MULTISPECIES: TDT family transporter [Streptomyces]ARP69391.1 C4-dicarboxylate ABC transporter [Streptomyces pluripotens]ASN23648.1 C4-dicarboxylate ABC transporter [Streptomyces pluripotens]KIE28320.1 C4-dicarboxylate ABC transporter [Streptomyces sp. MUSC 125]MCH0555340.1 TDT family transporter [Streptomyces sp. MUM 16J]
MVTSVQPLPLARAARFRDLGPNWYASVMGTAVVGSAGAALPGPVAGLRGVFAGFWALSLLMLVALLTARAVHWTHHRDQARAHLLDPAMASFYGCLSMALLAVGGGAMTAGRPLIGDDVAVALDAVLFTAGTCIGIAAAVAVPYLMAVRHRAEPSQTSPVWLLPLVAPMVSAALGPLLVPHLPPGQPRETLLMACLALFGLSLFATLLMLPLVFARLITSGPLPLVLTPTLFLVLGPLGQSTTAVGLVADAAPGVVAAPYDRGLVVFAVLYGVPVMGFALLWLGLATAHVARARRRGMGFAMTWWAFTFPVGTCVTGAAALARHTSLAVYDGLTVGLYALLVAAWGAAATGTVRGLVSGELLAGPRSVPAALASGKGRTRSGAAR